jgi:hypothetical protein
MLFFFLKELHGANPPAQSPNQTVLPGGDNIYEEMPSAFFFLPRELLAK